MKYTHLSIQDFDAFKFLNEVFENKSRPIQLKQGTFTTGFRCILGILNHRTVAFGCWLR